MLNNCLRSDSGFLWTDVLTFWIRLRNISNLSALHQQRDEGLVLVSEDAFRKRSKVAELANT